MVVKVPAVIAIVVAVAPVAQTPADVKSTPTSHLFKEVMLPALRVIVILKAGVEFDPLF
jgi:hypothetical protein